jgi:hypothetical protein
LPTGPKFKVFDLKQVKKGSTVVVTLRGSSANVRLLDSSNYQALKSGRQCKFAGGLVKRSPARLVVPRTGHWYVTVDKMGGLKGQTSASVSVEPPPLKEYRNPSQGSLTSIRHELPSELAVSDEKTWDVFISHASEDKEEVARPLKDALENLGVKVWFDESTLRIGDSLRRKIDAGLARSRCGVVIFSQAFFAKEWPQYELDGLVSGSINAEQKILPIWHEISKDEMLRQSPSLTGLLARNTMQSTIEEIAEEIADLLLGQQVEQAE